MRDTRLILIGSDGNPITRDDGGDRPVLVGLDLADIHNADARAPIFVGIEQKCDLLHWHAVGRTPLPNYDLGPFDSAG